jgi:hypothetical protein
MRRMSGAASALSRLPRLEGLAATFHVAIPEPTTYALTLGGLALLAWSAGGPPVKTSTSALTRLRRTTRTARPIPLSGSQSGGSF